MTLTLGELLVKPVEMGDEALRERYVQAIDAGVTDGRSCYSVPPSDRSRFAVGVCPRLATQAA